MSHNVQWVVGWNTAKARWRAFNQVEPDPPANSTGADFNLGWEAARQEWLNTGFIGNPDHDQIPEPQPPNGGGGGAPNPGPGTTIGIDLDNDGNDDIVITRNPDGSGSVGVDVDDDGDIDVNVPIPPQ